MFNTFIGPGAFCDPVNELQLLDGCKLAPMTAKTPGRDRT
jgi:hypothetical protein